jgi:hypothetical protein
MDQCLKRNEIAYTFQIPNTSDSIDASSETNCALMSCRRRHHALFSSFDSELAARFNVRLPVCDDDDDDDDNDDEDEDAGEGGGGASLGSAVAIESLLSSINLRCAAMCVCSAVLVDRRIDTLDPSEPTRLHKQSTASAIRCSQNSLG